MEFSLPSLSLHPLPHHSTLTVHPPPFPSPTPLPSPFNPLRLSPSLLFLLRCYSPVRTYAHYPNMPNFETESERISPGVIMHKEGWCSYGNIVFESKKLSE